MEDLRLGVLKSDVGVPGEPGLVMSFLSCSGRCPRTGQQAPLWPAWPFVP